MGVKDPGVWGARFQWVPSFPEGRSAIQKRLVRSFRDSPLLVFPNLELPCKISARLDFLLRLNKCKYFLSLDTIFAHEINDDKSLASGISQDHRGLISPPKAHRAAYQLTRDFVRLAEKLRMWRLLMPLRSIKSQMSLIWARRSCVDESAHWIHLWRCSGIPASFAPVLFRIIPHCLCSWSYSWLYSSSRSLIFLRCCQVGSWSWWLAEGSRFWCFDCKWKQAKQLLMLMVAYTLPLRDVQFFRRYSYILRN